MDNQYIKKFFDQKAKNWHSDESRHCIRKMIVERLALKHGEKILDLGCGKGVMVEYLSMYRPRHILELDISDQMIAYNRKIHAQLPYVSFMCKDIYEADLDRFDACILFNAYPHFLEKKQLAEILHKCLKQDGILLIAHDKSREELRQIHCRNESEYVLSTDLLSPLEEFRYFADDFVIEEYFDDIFYYLKMRNR